MVVTSDQSPGPVQANTIITVDSLLDILSQGQCSSDSTMLPLVGTALIFAVMHALLSSLHPCLTIEKLGYSFAQLDDTLKECQVEEVPVMMWVRLAVNRLKSQHSSIKIENNNLRFSCTTIWRYLSDLMHVTYAIIECHRDVYAVNVSLKNMAFTIALHYYLAARPEIVRELCKEVEECMEELGWTKVVVGKMRKLDSLLKET
ncbi:hypothetical protein K435DRAFT_961024 [Dendrothele bispora CBS 962.96]|uniref:Uncharacterized protein n=1 Tax=Dendrothele bispora (strain CBS 962.96) TaxID=1314807 RepID=A0A4S8MTS7_DENBC|nr:hypothetical protein K435DRAFT_961024 [Dendrothele bispora CBS 962.96]